MQDFTGSVFPKAKEKKSSCHQTLQAAGAETAAVRLEKQSGPSLKWPAPFNSHLRPDIPTVKISVHTPRVRQRKRLTTVPGPHTHTHTQGWPPPTAACDDISKASEKQDNCYCQPSCIHGQQTGAGVCVCVFVEIYQDMVESTGPSPAQRVCFKGTPAYNLSSYPNKVLRRQEVAQWAEIR